MKRVTLMAACAIAGVASAEDRWRLATPEELAPAWLPIAVADPTAQIARDFDGNGIGDVVRILVSPDRDSPELFGMMNEGSDHYRLLRLHGMSGQGIGLVKPGLYATASGKGYYDCEPDELTEVEIVHDGFRVFKWESASSIYYWDADSESFAFFIESD